MEGIYRRIRAISAIFFTLGLVTGAFAGTAQTITFPPIPVKQPSDGSFTLAATASSGLTVTYQIVGGAGVASVSGSTVTLTGASGAFTVMATQAGNGTFNAAPAVTQTCSVTSGSAFVQIASEGSTNQAVGIRADGTLWAWGSNFLGQLGDGNPAPSHAIPEQIGTVNTWKQVATGGLTTLAVKQDGTLWSWGSSSLGQRGNGTTISSSSPGQVGTDTHWASVAVGATHVVALKTDGTIWTWGGNSYGQLGQGTSDTSAHATPTQVGSANNWTLVTAGDNHTFGIQSDGSLWSWGYNSFGQLGQATSDTNPHPTPTRVGTSTSWLNALSASGGYEHSLVVRADGTLWAWGYNGNGQLGDGTVTQRTAPEQIGTGTNWNRVRGGYFHTIATKADGTLWAWGDNYFGEVGDGAGIQRLSPVQIGTDSNWSGVMAGAYFSGAIKSDGALLTWGVNLNGQLGLKSKRAVPVSSGLGPLRSASAGPVHTVAVATNGKLWAWGSNALGEVGNGSYTTQFNPVQIGSATNWTTVASGGEPVYFDFSMGIRSDGTLWGWGDNAQGQLGDGTTNSHNAPVQIGSATNWAQVACGEYHSIGMNATGTLWSWGNNASGQLGNGTTTNSSTPAQIGTNTWQNFAVGGNHCLAVRTDGTLWAWGLNSNGQLGDGTTTTRLSPIQIGTDNQWRYVGAGWFHSLGVKADGSLWAWGYNTYFQLGDGTSTGRNQPERIGTDSNWVAVAGGEYHSVALKSNGTLWAWGQNAAGQAGNLTNFSPNTPTQVGSGSSWTTLGFGSMANHTIAFTADGTAWGFGANECGQLASGGRNQNSPSYVNPPLTDQTISAPVLPSLVVGVPATLSATASSGLPVSYVVMGPATVSGNQITATGVGTVTVLSYQAGDGYWQATDLVTQITQSVALPTVTTLAADGVTPTGATFHGTVTANGANAIPTFEFGTTPSYGSSIAAAPTPVTGQTATAVSAQPTGLQPNTIYHYRLDATNSAGTVNGADATFTTPGVALSNFTYAGGAFTNGMTVTQSASFGIRGIAAAGVSRVEFYSQLAGSGTQTLIGIDATGTGGVFQASWNAELTPVDGSYIITLKAYDTLANVTIISQTVNLTLAPPPAPTITSPANNALVNTSNVIINGVGEPNGQTALYLNGVLQSPMFTAGADGTFSKTLTLPDGLSQVQAASSNRAGESPHTSINVTVDRTIPSPPTAVLATAQPGGAIQLTWTAALGTTAGYNVYRSTTSFTDPTQGVKVNTAFLTSTSFTDTPAVDGTYYYLLTSMNLAGSESPASSQVSALSDRSAPSVTSITYATTGKYDPATGRYGVGNITVTINVSESLGATPFFTITPLGGSPVAITLTKTGDLTYTGTLPVSSSTTSGLATATISLRDSAGNRGTTITSGGTVLIDTAGPSVVGLAIQPVAPVKNNPAAPVTVAFTATLDGPVKSGTVPSFNYYLSNTALTVIPVTSVTQGSDNVTWIVTINLAATAGQTTENLVLSYSASDDFDNVGTIIVPNHAFQVYEGDLPGLDSPLGLVAASQPGGHIALSWQSVAGAADYQLYRRVAGTGTFTPLAMSSGQLVYNDLPPADGNYDYTVASVREVPGASSIGNPSNTATALSDRTPPNAPTNLQLQLTARGVQANWLAPAGPSEPLTFNLYRASLSGNDKELAASIANQLLVTDSSPNPAKPYYTVTAVDAVGNESATSNQVYQNASLLPVQTLAISQTDTASPVIIWSQVSGNVAGYNIYQGPSNQLNQLNLQGLLTTTTFTDTGYSPSADRTYTVVTMDSTQAQSLGRSLTLPQISATLATGTVVNRGVMNQLNYTVQNNSAVEVDNAQINVLFGGQLQSSAVFSVAAGGSLNVPIVVGGTASLTGSSAPIVTTLLIAPNPGETVSIIRNGQVTLGTSQIQVSVVPGDFLLGGNGNVAFRVSNTSTQEIEITTASGQGAQPSPEVRFTILDADGNVIATQPFMDTTSAQIVSLPDGNSVLRLPAGTTYLSPSTVIPIPANASTQLTARLDIDKIYYHQGQPAQVVLDGLQTRAAINITQTSYTAVVTAITPAVSNGGQNVVITGSATNRADGTPAPNVPVLVVISKDGFDRSAQVTTDANGNFSYTFTPLAGEGGGIYQVCAVHPDLSDRTPQMTFLIQRVLVSPTQGNLSATFSSQQAVTVTATTGDGVTVHNLRMDCLPADQMGGFIPDGITVQSQSPIAQVLPDQSVQLTVNVTAASTAAPQGSLILRVSSDESNAGGWQKVTVNYQFGQASPVLQATPSLVNTGVNPGGTVSESVQLGDVGLASVTGLSVSLLNQDTSPAPAWVTFATDPATVLAIGGSKVVNLIFQPDSGVAEGDYFFILRIQGQNIANYDLNIHVAVTTSGVGGVDFKVVDAFTGTLDASGAVSQGVSGSQVQLQNEQVVSVQQTVSTDSFGEATINNLPVGSYRFTVNAPQHVTSSGRFWIRAGATASEQIALQYNPITVQWSVVPVTLQDSYSLSLNATFQTNVPTPVVVIDPPAINIPRMCQGDVYTGDFTVANYGLVRADHVNVQLPASDSTFKVELLGGVPTSIDSGQVVTVAYRMTALVNFGGSCGTATAGANQLTLPLAHTNPAISLLGNSQPFTLTASQQPAGTLALDAADTTPSDSTFSDCLQYFAQGSVSFDYTCSNGLPFPGLGLLPFFAEYGICAIADLVNWSPPTIGNNGEGAGTGTGGDGTGGSGGSSGTWGPGSGASTTPTGPAGGTTYTPIAQSDPQCYPTNPLFGSPLWPFENGPDWREPVGCTVNIMNRRYEDDIQDMAVPVPGRRDQSANVIRKFRAGQWVFFDQLAFVQDPISADGTYSEVDWQDFHFFQANQTRTLFRSGGVSITVNYSSNAARARLTTRDNSWIVFDSNGQVRSAGRNAVTFYTATYDVAGNRQQVTAGNGQVLLTYEWTAGLLTAVQDLTARRVEYTYTGGLLTKVKDPAGGFTTYAYDQFNRLSQITDSTGLSEVITYRTNVANAQAGPAGPTPLADGEVSSILDANGRGKYFQFSYDTTTGNCYGLIQTTGGPTDEKWYYADGQLQEWHRNGLLVRRALKSQRQIIQPSSQTYVFTYVYSVPNGNGGTTALVTRTTVPYPPTVWNLLSLDITDSNGATWKEDYDEFGSLVKVENPDGSSRTYQYDPTTELLIQSTNENGTVTKSQYDADRNVMEIDQAVGAPSARTIKMTYDAADHPLTTTWVGDAATPAATITNTYDGNGDLLQVTDPVQNSVAVLSRNLLGSVLQRRDGDNGTWLSAYDVFNRVAQSTDPDTHTTQFTYDTFNNVTSITAPSTRQTTFAYDINNSLVSTVDPTGKPITNVYDDARRLVQTIDREGKNTLYAYDALNRISTVTDGAGNQTSYTYDPTSASTDPVSITFPTYTRAPTYDDRHRLTQSVDTLAGGQTVTTTYTYSPTGALLSTVDGEGHTTTYIRDALDRPASITGDGMGTVSFTYDSRDHVIAFTNANLNTWLYTYDAEGRLTQEKTPLGKTTTFAYDGVGNLTMITRPDGSLLQRAFDSNGQIIWIKEFASGSSPPSKTITYTRDPDERVTAYTDGTTSGAYTFDTVGRLATESINYGTFSVSTAYTYYDNGLIKTYTSPGGTVSIYTYDSGNRLVSVSVPNVGEFSINSYSVNSVTKMTLPGGTAIQFTRDGYERPTEIKSLGPANQPILDLTLSYSQLGNILSRNDGSGFHLLQYDAARRLQLGISSSYTWDANGNRLTDANTGASFWQYDADDRLLSKPSNTYTYDDNGELIAKTTPSGNWTYAYDFEGHLSQVTNGSNVTQYYYGPDGRRLSKNVNGAVTNYHYCSFGLCAELDGNGNLNREYGYSPAASPGVAPLFVKTATGAYLYHTDQIGAPLFLTDANGNIVWAAKYDDFGNANVTANVIANNLRFPGQYFDAETGLHYNWNRYYDPEIGRYVTKDPQRDGANFYSYAGNNAFAFTDPDGLRAISDTLNALGDAGDWFADKFMHLGATLVETPIKLGIDIIGLGTGINPLTGKPIDRVDAAEQVAIEGLLTFGPQVIMKGAVLVKGLFGEVAANTGLVTGTNEAVFWSGIGKGGEQTAANWAAQNGGATLETTIASRGITLPVWDASNAASVAAWRQASTEFAAGASGNIRVLQGDVLRSDAIWADEFKALQANPKVTSIRSIHPETGGETLLWQR
jgi:RHS repeat-associated protein